MGTLPRRVDHHSWTLGQRSRTVSRCTAETLRKWMRQAERDAGVRGGLTTDERQCLKELEREVRELKHANKILRKASAWHVAA